MTEPPDRLERKRPSSQPSPQRGEGVYGSPLTPTLSPQGRGSSSSFGFPLALALLASAAAVVLAGAAVDIVGRPASVETLARRYLAALEGSDAEEALRSLAPSSREAWAEFVENGVANEYRVLGIAVRHSPVVDRLRGAPAGPHDVTIFLDITQSVDGARWQAAPRVPLVLENGTWYLSRPLLAPEPV